MTRVFNYKYYKYLPDPVNPRLLSENELCRPDSYHWNAGVKRAFAERLLSKFPNWKCVQAWAVIGFVVANGSEYLGEISITDAGTTKPRFHIINKRITSKRKRGGGIVTRDPDKAFKTVCKYFSSKTMEEQMDEALADAESWLNSEHYNTSTSFRIQLSNLAYAAKGLVMSNLDVYRAAAKAAGHDISKYSELEDLWTRSNLSDAMQNLISKDIGSLIKRVGNGYLINDLSSTEIFSVTDTLLSGPIREALGKLKLLESRTILDGVGARIDENTFFVVVK